MFYKITRNYEFSVNEPKEVDKEKRDIYDLCTDFF